MARFYHLFNGPFAKVCDLQRFSRSGGFSRSASPHTLKLQGTYRQPAKASTPTYFSGNHFIVAHTGLYMTFARDLKRNNLNRKGLLIQN